MLKYNYRKQKKERKSKCYKQKAVKSMVDNNPAIILKVKSLIKLIKREYQSGYKARLKHMLSARNLS